MNIYGFYHLVAINDYETLVEKQLNNLLQSKILDITDMLWITLIGDSYSVVKIDKLLKKHGIDNVMLLYCGNDINQFEFPALKNMFSLANQVDFYCYYFHTKGISITEKNYSWYRASSYNQLKIAVESWREYMEHFIFNKHETIIDKLSDYDSVGVSMTNNPSPHYPGNFWWSKSDYIKKLPILNTSNRYNAEFWIGSLPDSKMLSLSNKNISYIEKIEKPYE